MIKSADAPDFTIAVVGAGAMGQGIVQVCLQGGMKVILNDARPGGAATGADLVKGRLDRSVEKGRLEAADAAEMKSRLTASDDLDAIGPADTVVEAVFEDLEVKQDLFKRIEGIVGVDVPIATNTSSIPIASIGRVCARPDRVAGMHFFNPVPLMKLVEIIRGPETSDAVTAHLSALGKRMTRVPVTVKDSPGFLVNFGGRAYTTEALQIQHEGVATPAQIDAVMRDCADFRMGPFELMDLTGIDVNHPVSEFVHREFQYDPRIRTTPHHKLLKEAGRFGRKTKAGHFNYDDVGNKIDPPSPDLIPDAAPATSVWVPEPTEDLTALLEAAGLIALNEDDGNVPIIAAPMGEDATTFAFRNGADPVRLVAIDLTGKTHVRVTLMMAPGGSTAIRDSVAAAFIAAGRKVTAIKDSPGFILQRMRAMIANLGCEIAQIGLAVPADIDLALKLGLNYPLGPLEIVEDIGVWETLDIMEQIQAITGDDRYRPSLWLRRRALLSLPIHTEN